MLFKDGSGEVDVSELEELLEAAGEKLNPLELESVFQVGGAGAGAVGVVQAVRKLHAFCSNSRLDP